ncbi:glycosyl hydrolase family 95 catalytic domain-containing protein [Chitinophaga arvensicola]|uniref:Glycosyl hydrolase family 65, N-terminal domain n=1 Tax=Chitinophaga arvensicola TaxID=29529 RepID=A0A1I0S7X8_9BACT|nr:glycoside hydrolase N-terminal domain-containing protein [Chitinophaga arvensicola]SEW51955.1 Glycosyl hydrolase family 65, N-terminal domain [Chitinophaga arvensicola]
MKKLYGIVLAALCSQVLDAQAPLSAEQLAAKHALVYNKPAPDFFEGALLGNGGMGVVVTTRPDAVVLYFGHNNVWDIRIAENHRDSLRDFNYVFNRVKDIPDLAGDTWYQQYNAMAADNYHQPYPRPFPCGSLVLGFDRRTAELIGHTLDISRGVCTVKFLMEDKRTVLLELFTDMQHDQLYMQLTDAAGKPAANIFNRVKVMTDPSTPAEFPRHTTAEELAAGSLSFRQILPSEEPRKYNPVTGAPKDKAFRLTVQVNTSLKKTSRINWSGDREEMGALEAALAPQNNFNAVVTLEEGLNSKVSKALATAAAPTASAYQQAAAESRRVWSAYWRKSAVQLGDAFLEELWYRNLYFLNCAAREGVTCPGLFANWSYNKIGTAWHGDYHMNYNTQQPFWVTFSSNHTEKNLPYVQLIEDLMPVSRKWAQEYYHLPGAYFPHSAYPVEMTMNPYPVPDWGWEVSETPWAVQGLWWHYLYSGDTSFLRSRAYEPIRAAVQFLVAYMKRPDAHGGSRWKDDRYHIFPTVPPELYALRTGFKYNYDCTVDLTLTKFIFHAFEQATTIMGTTANEQTLLTDIRDILAHYPDYPTAMSHKYGKVLVSVPEEHDQVVYNLPNPLVTVFPGEEHGLHTTGETAVLLNNTFLHQQNEGGNDLVMQHLQAARIGQLDLDRFSRQVRYSLLPNGTATDMVMQTGGRYNDQTPFNYMAPMGIWFENFALPAVVNECLMQGYNGTIRLFPNWSKTKDAAFDNLRAAGAFLVSARQAKGQVTAVNILSEKGHPLKVMVPWGAKGSYTNASGKHAITKGVLELNTAPGERISLRP